VTETAVISDVAEASRGRMPRRRALAISRNLQSLALVPIIVIVAIMGSVVNPFFLTVDNIVGNIIAVSAALGVLVIAESIILIGGFFDLSLESVVGFSIMLLAVLVNSSKFAPGLGLPLWSGLLVTIGIVVVIGLVNGFLVAVLKLNAFIVTLAMLILIQGFTLGISNGVTNTGLPDFVLFLGSANFFGIPIQAVIFVVAFAAAALFLRYTPTGRSIYALGGNMDAARAAGVRTRRLTIGLFVSGSLLAMVAGFMLAGKTAAATPTLGEGMIFTVFAAAVLGGIDLNGGRGTLVGAALGVLLLGMIQNILILSNVPSFWINAAYGAIIICALIVGSVSSIVSAARKKARA
jgi:simple sugar transport system permease protein